MKKINFIIVIMIIISNVTLAQSINEPYNFPLKPGMPEWANLKSGAEMVTTLQIPQNILSRMTTKSLLETCLNYPLFIVDIIAYGSSKVGMEYATKNFNGFTELLKRKDAYNYLSEKFISFDPLAIDKRWSLLEQGCYTFELIKIELLLAQNIVLESTSYENKIHLLKEALSKYEKMLTQKDYYVGYQYEQLFFLMGKVLQNSGNSDISSLAVNNKEISKFLETGKLYNYDVINEILSIVKKIL